MKPLRRVLAAAAVTTVAAASLTAGLASVAHAAGTPPWEPDTSSVGGLTFYNASGQQITGGNLTDAPLAAYVEGSATVRAGDTKATLYGYLPKSGQVPGQWGGEQLSSSTTYPNAAAPGALASATQPVVTGATTDESIATLEADFPNTDTSTDGYAGLYQLRLETTAAGKAANTTYDSADIQISGSTWSVVYPARTLTSTTTTLTASPSSPQTAGTAVTLTATVSPSAPGTVQFENGTTSLGSPVTVSGGTASISVTGLPVGSDALNAVFTPAPFSAYSGSTGTLPYTISAPPATATTTALAVNPSTAPADTAVALTADVTTTTSGTPLAAGDGSVAFYDDGATDSSGDVTGQSILLGTAPLGTGGVATLSYGSFATGAHNLVAQFQPANSGTYNGSNSSAVLFTATTPQYAPASGTVDVAIPAGTLTITTPYSTTNPFQLGTAALNAGDSAFVATAPFGSSSDPSQGVTVTDTRAGDLPWTASVESTNFADGSNDLINAQNLTLTGVTPSYISGNALQSGDVTTTDVTNTAVYGPTASGNDGLAGVPHTFAQAAKGAGSVYLDGTLGLTAPTSSPAGSYTATLTFTIA